MTKSMHYNMRFFFQKNRMEEKKMGWSVMSPLHRDFGERVLYVVRQRGFSFSPDCYMESFIDELLTS